ncbi:MAG TPA: hypothetical protein V6C81_03260 [Planktothrix sp.]
MADLSITINPNYNARLNKIKDPGDIPQRWKDTPIEQLILAQNFDHTIAVAETAQLFICTCIDFRVQPKVPPYYAYLSRIAGGKVSGSEFALAYAVTRGVRHAAMIAHNDCGMTKVSTYAPSVTNVLVEQGWPRDVAEQYVTEQGAKYAIEDEIDSLKREFIRVRRLFPKLEIAPLFTSLANGHLYLPKWYDPESGTAPDKVIEQDLLLLQ